MTVWRALNIDESTKASKASRARDAIASSLVIRGFGTNVLDCGRAGARSPWQAMHLT